MRTLITLLAAMIILPIGSYSYTPSNDQKDGNDEIKVYYFHYSHRCATCISIEENSIAALQKYDNSIPFKSVNLDEKSGETLGALMNIEGQTLLIIKGDKRIDLTDQAFLYTKSKPDKLIGLIQRNIDQLLKEK